MNKFLKKILGCIYHPILYRIRNSSLLKQTNELFLVTQKIYRDHNLFIPKQNLDRCVSMKTAIQIHIFYIDLLKEFYRYLEFITIPYDLFISTDSEVKKKEIEVFFRKNKLGAKTIEIEVFDNIGRDVYPFLQQLKIKSKNYEYIAHFHTKKTLYESFGNKWRKSLLDSCIGKKNHFDNIIKILDADESIGLVLPSIPNISHVKRGYVSTKIDNWNNSNLPVLLRKAGVKTEANLNLLNYEHPAGNMFIARTKAIKQIFELDFDELKFPSEEGQKKHTLQHLIELIWHPLAFFNGYDFRICHKQL